MDNQITFSIFTSYCKRLFSRAFLLLLLSNICFAQMNPIHIEKNTQQLYHNLSKNLLSNEVSERIVKLSELLLYKPYHLWALGEGENSAYDQYPLYRLDQFDCETFVDTVLALALSNSFQGFKQCMNTLRYRQGNVSFLNRNHFTCLDWNKNNQQNHILKDITATFTDQNQQKVSKLATALINKASWYEHLPIERIRLTNTSPEAQAAALLALQQSGQTLPAAWSTTDYIPLTALFDKAGKANWYLFKQIPNAAIIEIVRPNWDCRKTIGTALNVSHLGFAIWKQQTLYFRQASSNAHATIDVPLVDYLKDALQSPTIKGINVQIVQAKTIDKPLCG